jgi:3-oxoacyl-[acyl-carrier protein] reductase
MSELAGRVCLVTGASRGIGRAIALLLAGRGADVVGTYRSDASAAGAVEADASAASGSVRMAQCDVTDEGSVRELVDELRRQHGRIDGLVNNAGVWRGGRLVDLPATHWRQVVDADLTGVFTVLQAVLPAMLEAGSGRVVNVTSVIGLVGYPGDAAYSAAKGGVNSMTKSLAKELARSGVAVNAVAPGPIATEMTEQLGERGLARLVERIPIRRQGQPEEVASLVAYLLEAPLFLTGAVIPLDGGMS